MKVINNEKKYNNIDNGLSNIKCKCGCCFSATESDIEVEVISVPYERGIKKALGMSQGHICNRYITCPSCFRKMKVKFYVEDKSNE